MSLASHLAWIGRREAHKREDLELRRLAINARLEGLDNTTLEELGRIVREETLALIPVVPDDSDAARGIWLKWFAGCLDNRQDDLDAYERLIYVLEMELEAA